MLVSEIMRKDFLTLLPTDSILEAAQKMKENKVGVALVLEDEKFRGILTEREIYTALGTEAAALEHDAPNKADDGNRCNYFNEVLIDLLAGK